MRSRRTWRPCSAAAFRKRARLLLLTAVVRSLRIALVARACLALGAASGACVQVSEQQTTEAEPAPRRPSGPCSDPASRLVYAIGARNTLYGFDPRAASFYTIHDLVCPDAGGPPVSMAVDRNGRAYLDAQDGTLFRVDTTTGECIATSFDAGATGFVSFYGAFTTAEGDGGEALFGSWSSATAPRWTSVLGSIDTSALRWKTIGDYSPGTNSGPTDHVLALTGTGDGLLFALVQSETSVVVARLDPATATVLARDPLFGVSPEPGAFVAWGGEFYLFGACGGDICRVDPRTMTIVRFPVPLGDTIALAAVSTCAPFD
jgi:streptogramin lyase